MPYKFTITCNLSAEVEIEGAVCSLDAEYEALKAFEKAGDILHDTDITTAGDNFMTATMLFPELNDIQRV